LVGVPYAFTVDTKWGYPAPAVTVAGGSLPTGVTLTDNGNGTASLTGTPGSGTGGIYPLTISATISAGHTTSQSFVLTVYQAPAITSAAIDTISRGVAMTPFAVMASGYPAPIFKASGLPMGITMNGNSIVGTTEAQAGTYNGTITAKSKAGVTTHPFTLTICP